MDQQAREQALQTALATEHFVLQAAASATINEGNGRSTMYLLSLSSGLVALGFAGQYGDTLMFAAVVLPTVFGLGLFTIVRLVDVSIENVIGQRRIGLIRAYYATLLPAAAALFSDEVTAGGRRGVSTGRFLLLFTMASMIGVVNSVVGGSGVTLLLMTVWAVPHLPALLGGGLTAAVLLAWVAIYQRIRFSAGIAVDPTALHRGRP